MVKLRIATCALALAALAADCGGSSSPTGPSAGTASGGTTGGSGSNSASCTVAGPLGSVKGVINATINGTPFFGGVPTGQSIYTPIAAQPALGLPAQDFFVIGGTCGDLTSLVITARATTGTTSFGVDANGSPLRDPQSQQPLIHSAILQLRANGVAAGTWNTSLLGGSGTITLAAIAPSGASGSFSLTMVPQPTTGASGNRTVTGQFNVTF
jgi:hypothetical protein